MRREAIIVVIAILVVASLGIGYLGGSSARSTDTVTSTTTMVTTTASLVTTTSMITSSTGTTNTSTILQLYHQVTFNETGCIGPGAQAAGDTVLTYMPRWYVTMDNVTIVQPSNATLPFANPGNESSSSPAYATISTIVFTVPDGNYTYHASLGVFIANGQSEPFDFNGTVAVNGSNVVIPVEGPLCIVY